MVSGNLDKTICFLRICKDLQRGDKKRKRDILTSKKKIKHGGFSKLCFDNSHKV